jgi:hypothetical protein
MFVDKVPVDKVPVLAVEHPEKVRFKGLGSNRY